MYAKVKDCFSKDCNAKLRVVNKHSTLLINSSYYSTIRVLSYGHYHVGLIVLKSCWLLRIVDYKNHMIHMIEQYEYWVKQQNIKSTKHKIFL